jgi:hypothetical protein
MKIKTNAKAGGIHLNHNQGLKLKTQVKAGGINLNHSQGLKLKTQVKAGGIHLNHNETPVKVTLKGASVQAPKKVIVKTNLRAGTPFHRAW